MLVCISIALFVSLSFYFTWKNYSYVIQPNHQNIVERNLLSRLLNKEKQIIGQLECRSLSVSKSGGWCMNDSGINSKEHITDFQLAEYLSQFLKGKLVGSFGDGPGLYRKYFDETRLLQSYDAYDGAPFSDSSSEGRVKFLDLSVPQYGLPVYDWIISLEVAEHIPQQYEQVYLSNLARHAGTGIILSWDAPGQDGLFHVNNRPLNYVINAMKMLGFDHDKVSSSVLQSHAYFSWLNYNTNVYYRQKDNRIDINQA